jgi:hypothetical protein
MGPVTGSTTPPPAVKTPTPPASSSAPPAVKPAAPTASAPVTTPPPAVKPGATPIKPSDVPGLGPNDVAPNKSPFSGRNPQMQAGGMPSSVTNTLSKPDNTAPTMFNKLPTGTFGATKESSELARIKNLAGLK